MRLRSISAIVFAGCISLAGSALAGDYDSALTLGVVARDRALESGSKYDWQRAYDLFLDARNLRCTKEASFELAEAAAHLGRVDEAYEYFLVAIRVGLQGKARQHAQNFLSAKSDLVGEIEIVGPTGGFVYVNGRYRAVLPLRGPLVVPVGAVRLYVGKAGQRPWQVDLQVSPRGKIRVSPALPEDPNFEIEGTPREVNQELLRAGSVSGSERDDNWLYVAAAGGAALSLAGLAMFTIGSENAGWGSASDGVATARVIQWTGLGAVTLGASAFAWSLASLPSRRIPGTPSTRTGITVSSREISIQWGGVY